MKTILSMLTGALFFLSHAQAGEDAFETGHDLLKYSNLYIQEKEGNKLKDEDAVGTLLLHSYVEGFISGVRMSQHVTKKVFISLPDKPTHEQFIRVINKYLKKNPESLHDSARVLTILALVEAFPKNN